MKEIKNVVYLILSIAIIAVFTMCSDDDNPAEGPTQDERLVGNWTLIKITIPLMNMQLTPEEAGMMMTGVANADGTMELTTIDSSGTLLETAMWSTNNGKITMIFEDETVVADYSVDGTIISITTPLEIEEGVEMPAILDFRKD